MEKRIFFTVAETASLLRVHPESIRRAVRDGKIDGAIRVAGGRLIRIPTDYVEKHDEGKKAG